MRILILTQYYPPEVGAPQNRLSDLARRLSKLGHDVSVLTALPNYPKGEVFEEYRDRLIVDERVQGLRVIRTWIYATKNKNFVHRLMNYFSFVVSSLAVGAWKIGSQDAVVVESPPLFLGLAGYILSRLKGARFVFNVSDLWPQSAVAMGILHSKPLIGLSTWLEEFLYKRSHLITGQTLGIVDNIRSRFPYKRVSLVTNGVDLEAYADVWQPSQKERVRGEFGIDREFVVGYAGLHGLAQGLETMIQVAQIVSNYEGILFAFFGDGPEKERLIQLAGQAQLTNVMFLPSQPRERMPDVLSSFDVALIPLRRLDLFKGALPSKMFEAMAAGIPLVLAVEGEARKLVDDAQCGICVEPENSQAIAAAVVALCKDPECRRTLGNNGRRYVIRHYDRGQIARRFHRLLEEIHFPNNGGRQGVEESTHTSEDSV